MDVADAYVTFVRHSQDVLRDKVNEEIYIERLFDVSKCLLHLGQQGGDTPKCDKIKDRGISHILKKNSDLLTNLSFPSDLLFSALNLYSGVLCLGLRLILISGWTFVETRSSLLYVVYVISTTPLCFPFYVFYAYYSMKALRLPHT